MNEKKNNINDLLTAIETIAKQTSFNIWIPSLGKNLKFSDINTGQQKEIIRAVIDNPVYKTNFILAFYNIIKANCQEAIDVDSLTIFDKLAIAIQLRQHSIGTSVKTDTTDIDIGNLDPTTKFIFNEDLKQKTYEQDGITLTLGIPSIKREMQLEQELRSKLTKNNIENYEDVRNILADAYIGELAKYVIVVKVGDNAIITSDIDFKQAYKLVETLPGSLVKQAVAYLEESQRLLTSWATFPNSNGEPTELTIDAAFFTGK